MRVFVTGASGFVGSAVVQELLRSGHVVVGLARSDASAAALAALGVEVHRGDITDMESLRAGAAKADGVIHTAFNHDFSRFKESCEEDRAVIEALNAAYVGSERPLVITSGIGVLPSGGVLTEESKPAEGAAAHPRAATEQTVAKIAAAGANVSVVRLPPSTHGAGDHGFVPILIGLAREKKISVYIGEGTNAWPAVHRLDAAVVYRTALERAVAGSVYHAVAESGVEFRKIAETIGRQLRIPVTSKSGEEAAAHFTWFAHFAAMDKPSSSDWTRRTLSWRPTQPGLIADMESGNYFA